MKFIRGKVVIGFMFVEDERILLVLFFMIFVIIFLLIYLVVYYNFNVLCIKF